MKIKIFSDLHVEFSNKSIAKQLVSDESVDINIFAGDFVHMGEAPRLLHFLDDLSPCPILFVPGNHEYYGTRKNTVDEQFKEHSYYHTHILNPGTFLFNDVLFIGATGWWDNVSRSAMDGMNDFTMIADIHNNDNGCKWGNADKSFFLNQLKNKNSNKIVCISHHAPSYKSIPDDLSDRPINPCYVNDWESILLQHEPDMWVHGHIHQCSNDYFIGKTRVMSNPYGYLNKNKLNPDWNDNCIIEL